MQIKVAAEPSHEDVAAVLSGLSHFNEQELGPANRRSLAVVIKVDGDVKAGLVGYTAWGALHVEKLWVSDALRGQGIAAQLLHQAENEAVERSCALAWLDTLNPDAARLYERLGYRLFGEISQFAAGRSRQFYQKSLIGAERQLS